MKCPTCPDTTLVLSDRQGVEIDYCPACRGIWLDRGELDKLLDRAAVVEAPASTAHTSVSRGRPSGTLRTPTTASGNVTLAATRNRGLARFLIDPRKGHIDANTQNFPY